MMGDLNLNITEILQKLDTWNGIEMINHLKRTQFRTTVKPTHSNQTEGREIDFIFTDIADFRQ